MKERPAKAVPTIRRGRRPIRSLREPKNEAVVNETKYPETRIIGKPGSPISKK